VSAQGNGVAPSTIVAAVGGAAILGLLGFMFLRTRHGHAPPPPPPAPATEKASEEPTKKVAEKEWVRVTPEGAGYSVAFPAEPAEPKTGTLDFNGKKVPITSLTYDTPHSLFTSGHAVLPPDVDPDIQLLAKSLAASWKLEVTHSMTISYKGSPCADFEGKLEGRAVKLHGRVFVAQGVLHVLLVGTDDDSIETADKFFDGIQLEAR